jgi:hypothetical protein
MLGDAVTPTRCSAHLNHRSFASKRDEPMHRLRALALEHRMRAHATASSVRRSPACNFKHISKPARARTIRDRAGTARVTASALTTSCTMTSVPPSAALKSNN